ncbi:hypothetical protein [Ectopseudomonas toyotomiensis]|uniref:Uncharacterized protein n=1 Tax=Ectopseudomonas toyotomiensis TaxID=554344 RepID=A0AA42IP31_9GAMM|nr:hypothetical protein [Pseudomonas toyotomiensis]MBG0838862.1 hypothetical protein [Pseudomonas toyotomiensis]MDH0700064.1 hypothetical protein [Pseudomonas toyotomiensis]
MTDKAWMKAELLKATESLIDMASESELKVLGELIGLQLLKACFVRRAGDLGMNAEQLESARLDIEETQRKVMELVKLLDETNANAIQAVTAPKH